MPGFVKLLTAADIPQGGKNSFISLKADSTPEEVCYFVNCCQLMKFHVLLSLIISLFF